MPRLRVSTIDAHAVPLDAHCHWCLAPIRWAPIARRWWHVQLGTEACGERGILAEHHAQPTREDGDAYWRATGTAIPRNALRRRLAA